MRLRPLAARGWLSFALMATAAVFAGCMPKLHLRLPATIEVVDALTGEPVAGAEIVQCEQGEYFRAGYRERAVTGADGSARMIVMAALDWTWWEISRSDPGNSGYEQEQTFYGVGFSQIPREFTEISKDHYRAPLWPSLEIAVELPTDFIGLIALKGESEDSPDGRGWKPPLSVGDRMTRRAVVRPDSPGTIAYPSSIGGMRGFGFPAGHMLRRNGAWLLMRGPFEGLSWHLLKKGKWEVVKQYESEVLAWRIGLYARPPELGDRWNIWFVGSLVDLRAFISANSLKCHGEPRQLTDCKSDIAATRSFDWDDMLPLLGEPRRIIPEWTEREWPPREANNNR